MDSFPINHNSQRIPGTGRTPNSVKSSIRNANKQGIAYLSLSLIQTQAHQDYTWSFKPVWSHKVGSAQAWVQLSPFKPEMTAEIK